MHHENLNRMKDLPSKTIAMRERDAVRKAMSADDCENLRVIELLFFAYRSFVTDADVVLADFGFGRAHHRVLHFVNRLPGLTVAELLDILKITKQSLSRVLRELVETGHIVQQRGASDRRQRLLYPTKKGRKLALKLSGMQSRRIDRALEMQDQEGKRMIDAFLRQMTDEDERPFIDMLHSQAGS